MSHKEIFGRNEADELLLRKNYADISSTGRVLNNLLAFVGLAFACLFVVAGIGLKWSYGENLRSQSTANARITGIKPTSNSEISQITVNFLCNNQNTTQTFSTLLDPLVYQVGNDIDILYTTATCNQVQPVAGLMNPNNFGNLLLFVGVGMLISLALFWWIISNSIGTLANIMSK